MGFLTPRDASVVARSTKSSPISRSLSLLIACLLLPLLLQGCGSSPVALIPDALLDLTNNPSESSKLYTQLSSDQTPADQRVQAATVLLNLSSQRSINLLKDALADTNDPRAIDAVLQAIILSPDQPPRALYESIYEVLLTSDGPLQLRAAEAISRYTNDQPVATDIIRLATNKNATLTHRQAAILVLSRMHSRTAAQTLINLTAPEQPEAIRTDAYFALTLMTGIDIYRNDRAKWLAWWERVKTWSQDRWYVSLLDATSRQNARQRLELDETSRHLFSLARSSYRNANVQDQSRILAYMLTDVRPARQLAMELVLERILGGQPFDNVLLEALRSRLDDPDPQIRHLAALRLNDLADNKAADIVAKRLAEHRESSPLTLHDDLLLLTNMPRAEAVPVAIDLLDKQSLSPIAAGMLVAAENKGLLDENQTQQISEKLHALIRPDQNPYPQYITLLAAVGNEQDWDYLQKLIDSHDVTVKQAAAKAWANSDHSLKLLADRATDPVIQPIVIAAATERGNDPDTLETLAQNPPEQPQSIEAWSHALTEMSKRVDPAKIELIAERIATNQLPNAASAYTLAINMLTAAIDQLQQNADKLTPDQQRTLDHLLLERGIIELQSNNVTNAISDFDKVDQHYDTLSQQMRDRLLRNDILALLRRDRIQDAFLQIDRLLLLIEQTGLQPKQDRIIIALVEHAETYFDADRKDEAQQMADLLQARLGQGAPLDIAQRLDALQTKLQ